MILEITSSTISYSLFELKEITLFIKLLDFKLDVFYEIELEIVEVTKKLKS